MREIQYSESKVLGVLLGTFIGDAIGAEYEGLHPNDISPLTEKSILRPHSFKYSDDTQMAISVFEEMAENGEIKSTSLVYRFLKRFSQWRGYSGGILDVFEKWKDNQSIETTARDLYEGTGSFGDGAAVRIAPISCFFKLNETAELITEVKKCSMLTHTHSIGIDGAIVQAYSVLLALNEIPLDNWLQMMFELPIDSAFKIKFGLVEQSLKRRSTAKESAEMIGNGSDALSAVCASIFAFLRNRESFIDSIFFSIEQGGDTDTIGAMTGAISGAWFKYENIPHWVMEHLENDSEGKDFLFSLVKKHV